MKGGSTIVKPRRIKDLGKKKKVKEIPVLSGDLEKSTVDWALSLTI